MIHQNFQEAIEQISTDEDSRGTLLLNPDEIRAKFNLNEEEMMAMKSYNLPIQGVTQPAPGNCCCCCCA